jgi:hypothetical protein
MEAIPSSKTSTVFYTITLRYVPEDLRRVGIDYDMFVLLLVSIATVSPIAKLNTASIKTEDMPRETEGNHENFSLRAEPRASARAYAMKNYSQHFTRTFGVVDMTERRLRGVPSMATININVRRGALTGKPDR